MPIACLRACESRVDEKDLGDFFQRGEHFLNVVHIKR